LYRKEGNLFADDATYFVDEDDFVVLLGGGTAAAFGVGVG